MLRENGYYATPVGSNTSLDKIADDMVHFSASCSESLPMALFCDFYHVDAKAIKQDEVFFNHWGTAVKVRRVIKNSNDICYGATVVFVNIDSEEQPSHCKVVVYREQADIDVRSTYISPDSLVFG